ncbi:MAG: outer membrane beta-barrel protein [Bdellovibrionales bacterium]|nr:outer membrane beta-barrel protein [Bdellovibrionales bacterium]
MKVLLALAVLATSATALAADNREIQDIMYLPNTGTTYGFSTIQITNGEEKADAGDTETTGYNLTQSIGHSFTDRFLLQADLSYADFESDDDSVGGTKTNQTGISDPTISARFRTMDESFRWDVIAGATLGFVDREQDSDGDLNNHQGGSSLFVGTQFGGKSESFQWAILGLLTHNREATVDVDGLGDVDLDANNELLTRLDVLSRLGDKSFLRSNVAANFAEGYEDDQSPSQEFAAPETTYSIGTEFQHLISKDLMLRAGVDYSIANRSSGQVDDITAWNFLGGANYQF